jgi:hypothetical protein
MTTNKENSKVLFICKRREDYGQCDSYSHHGVSTGLLNSARFVSDMLASNGIQTKNIVVIDNNCIDREVRAYKPTHVIIEALWVVPEKFEILTKLHPNVKWIVRYHSEIPFVATEGIAMEWLFKFLAYPNVAVSGNSRLVQEELEFLAKMHFGYSDDELKNKVVFLPNYYDLGALAKAKKYDKSKDFISVGCFGAIRPLKNQLIQAVAAIKFAESKNKKLKFHINGNRVEGNGAPILKNLRGLFDSVAADGHVLIEHPWMPHDKFIKMLSDEIDIGLQVSFSETFNIVAADMISAGIPVVASEEVKWVSPFFNANPTLSDNIVKKMKCAWRIPTINVKIEQCFLKLYVNRSERVWVNFFKGSE